ncbi:hypothetical protein CDQ91_20460 [Sphingopyxis witflariensis]|uniref:Uncharacterized protein n=1 Tax=Sphingopyxis witflariensis TaxID=173675 RepID=A0A246JDC0_9SPHN|nr:hypothetical protein CDQ91_20460 [Sphingopyxis witflariensis]
MATKHIDHPQAEGDRIPGGGRQAIEGNPLTLDEISMFEMFEREGWSPDRRRAHIFAFAVATSDKTDI